MTSDELKQWGERLASERGWVFCPSTGLVDEVAEFYDGEDSAYVSTVNGQPVSSPVVVLRRGDAVLLDADKIIELHEREAEFFQMVVVHVASLVAQMAQVAGAQRLPAPTTGVLLKAALQAQARHL